MPYFILSIIVLTIITSIARYLRTLKFRNLKSPYTLLDNIKAIKYFLSAQHLAFSQHPRAPEVFQILSKNISFSGEQREVMVFIADDYRILVNSHFTEQKFSIMQPSGQSKGMANRLEKWLGSYTTNSNSTITTVNSF